MPAEQILITNANKNITKSYLKIKVPKQILSNLTKPTAVLND